MILSKRLLLFLVIIYIFGGFIGLDKIGFGYSESRQAIISLEMNYSHKYLTPKVLGKAYFGKPPLYNVVVALFFKTLGTNEFAARFVSVLFMFGISLTVFFVLKSVMGFESAVFGAFSFGLSFIVYFQYGMLANVNMFFSFLIFLSMVCIFYNRVFLGSVFAFFALLSGGLTALVFFYLTLFSYALIQKKFKQVIYSTSTLYGGWLILFLFIGWLLLVSGLKLHRFDYVLGSLIRYSFGGILNVGDGNVWYYITNILLFPVRVWSHFLIFSFLFLLLIKEQFRQEFFQIVESEKKIGELFKFSLAVFISSIIVYILTDNDRIGDILVLFTVLAFIVGLIYYEIEYLETFDFSKLFIWIFYLFVVFFFVGFIFDLGLAGKVNYFTYLAGIFLCIIGVMLLKKAESNAVALLVGFVILSVSLRILFVGIYQSYLYNYHVSYPNYADKMAKIILSKMPKCVMTDGGNLKLFFYLERDLGMQLVPINLKRSCMIVTRNPRNISDLFVEMELPDHVYYIGEK